MVVGKSIRTLSAADFGVKCGYPGITDQVEISVAFEAVKKYGAGRANSKP